MLQVFFGGMESLDGHVASQPLLKSKPSALISAPKPHHCAALVQGLDRMVEHFFQVGGSDMLGAGDQLGVVTITVRT
jgi:hypothetical protein